MTLKLDDFEPVAIFHGTIDCGEHGAANLEILKALYRSQAFYSASQLQQLIDQCNAKDAEIAHWKNNHETEVRRARLLKERTDMPIERVQAYEKWGEDKRQLATLQTQNAELLADAERYRKLLDLTRLGCYALKYWDTDRDSWYLVDVEEVTNNAAITKAKEGE